MEIIVLIDQRKGGKVMIQVLCNEKRLKFSSNLVWNTYSVTLGSRLPIHNLLLASPTSGSSGTGKGPDNRFYKEYKCSKTCLKQPLNH